MGQVITVMNMKGGVGKTTVAMHLGGLFARYLLGAPKPRRILLIDYDPQFNLSQAFLPSTRYFALDEARKTTLAILLDDERQLNPYELQVPGSNRPPAVAELATRIYAFKEDGCLDMIPSTLDLMYVALGQTNAQIQPIEERFERFIRECKLQYDLTIIDCHLAGSIFTKTSLQNSDHVVIPVMPQRYAVRGIGLMLAFIEAKRVGTTAPTPHILFNATPRKGVKRQEIEIRADAAFAKHCMTATLKKYTVFSDPEGGAGFVWSSGKPYSTEAFHNLLQVGRELLTRIGA
jgi:chromosome partitioning protein